MRQRSKNYYNENIDTIRKNSRQKVKYEICNEEMINSLFRASPPRTLNAKPHSLESGDPLKSPPDLVEILADHQM